MEGKIDGQEGGICGLREGGRREQYHFVSSVIIYNVSHPQLFLLLFLVLTLFIFVLSFPFQLRASKHRQWHNNQLARKREWTLADLNPRSQADADAEAAWGTMSKEGRYRMKGGHNNFSHENRGGIKKEVRGDGENRGNRSKRRPITAAGSLV